MVVVVVVVADKGVLDSRVVVGRVSFAAPDTVSVFCSAHRS